MRECLSKSGNLTNLTSTITKCQMLVWPELIFSDPPVSHLGDVFFATFSPSLKSVDSINVFQVVYCETNFYLPIVRKCRREKTDP